MSPAIISCDVETHGLYEPYDAAAKCAIETIINGTVEPCFDWVFGCRPECRTASLVVRA